MAADPVRSTNLAPTSSAIEILVNYDVGSGARATGRLPLSAARQLIASAIAPGVARVADLTLNWPANTETRVYGEASSANNGVYIKTGASGAGGWTRLGPIPEINVSNLAADVAGVSTRAALRLTQTARTDNDITASSSPAISALDAVANAWFTAQFTNTGPVTVKIGSLDPIPLVDQDGNALAPGDLLIQRHYLLKAFISGETKQLRIVSSNIRRSELASAASTASGAAASASDAKIAAERVQLAQVASTRGWTFAPTMGLAALPERSPASLQASRASTTWRTNVRGFYEIVGLNVLHHSYAADTGAWRGVRLEPQRTNSFLYSRDFANEYWSKELISVDTAVAGPDGLVSAQRLFETIESGAHAVARTDNVTAGDIISCSYVVAPIGSRGAAIQFDGAGEGGGDPSLVYFTLSGDGAVVSATPLIRNPRVSKLSNGFYLISATIDAQATGSLRSSIASTKDGSQNFPGETNCGLSLWHAQRETGLGATSRIVTTDAPATRAVTSLTGTVGDGTAGTVFVRFTISDLPTSGAARIAGVYADENNRAHLSVNSAGQLYLGAVLNGSSLTLNGPVVTAGQEIRAAFSYRNGAQFLAVNGTLWTAGAPVAQKLVGSAIFVIGSKAGLAEPSNVVVSEAYWFAQPHSGSQTLLASASTAVDSTLFVATHQRVEIASDPSKNMTLVWHGDAAAPAAVEYRALGSSSWMSAGAVRKDMPFGTEKISFATVTGLSPDTIYEWRAAGSGSAGIKRFRTLSNYRARNLRIAAASDWQRTSSEALSPTSHFNVLNSLIASRQADIVLLVGDYAADNGATSSTLTQRWRDFIQGWSSRYVDADGCQIPVCAIAGNHEAGYPPGSSTGSWDGVGTYGYMDRLFSTFYRPGVANSSNRGYGWFEVGSELLCIGLETNHATPLGPQVAWLSQLLAAKANQFRHVVVYMHFGPVAYQNSAWSYAGCKIVREQIMPVIQSYPNCRFAIQGHNHNLMATRKVKFVESPAGGVNAWSEQPDGIRVLGAGGWSSPDWLPFDVQDQASNAVLGDGSVLIEYLVASNQSPRNVTPISSPNNTTTDPATKHFWLIELGEADQTAKAISLNNTELISLTESVS